MRETPNTRRKTINARCNYLQLLFDFLQYGIPREKCPNWTVLTISIFLSAEAEGGIMAIAT